MEWSFRRGLLRRSSVVAAVSCAVRLSARCDAEALRSLVEGLHLQFASFGDAPPIPSCRAAFALSDECAAVTTELSSSVG